MDHQAFAQLLGNYGEFLGAIAVVVTLIYLAVQIRQNTESLRLGAELELSRQITEWHSRVTADPELVRIWNAAIDSESMGAEDGARFTWLVAEVFHLYEGHFEFYRKGHLSEKSWQPKIQTLLGLLQNPLVAHWWNQKRSPIGGDFREYIDSIQQNGTIDWEHKAVGNVTNDAK